MFDEILAGPLTPRMPVLFIGHGNPMNAIDANAYTRALNALPATFDKPRAIIVISAHWMTNGTWITEMPQPRTIHDFYGFPQALFDIQYPAPGDADLARSIRHMIDDPFIQADTETWGLDHGTWAVLRHMYPGADIPVLQLSLDLKKPPQYHIDIGAKLSRLRDRGVLLLGSGNLVHNLRQIKWEPHATPHDWAFEFDDWLKKKID